MTMIQPRVPEFPENPEDGFQIKEELTGGGYALWTYREQFNEWTCELYTGFIPGFIYTDQVLTRGETAPVLKEGEESPALLTQRDVNHFLNDTAADIEIGPQQLIQCTRIAPPEGTGSTFYEGGTDQPLSIQTRDSVEARVDGLASEEYVNEAISQIPDPPSLDGHVTKQEFAQGQAEQDLEIAKLEDKVDQLQGKAGQGKWKYDNANTNPRPGDFNLLGNGNIPTSQWADVVVIKFSSVDAVGHNYDFHRAVEGDVIKLGYELGPEASYAEFQVTASSNGVFGVVRLLSHEGTARDGWRYDVEHFSSFDPAGVATQDYVDEGDDAVKEYVDQRVDSIPEVPIDDYLKKDGDTMTGSLRMKRTDDVNYWNYIYSDKPSAWEKGQKEHGLILNIGSTNSYKQQFKIQGRGNQDLFEIHDDNSAKAVLYGRLNATEGLKSGGKNVATEEYIDDKVLHATLPGFRWKYASHATAEELVAGEFFINSSGNLYFHPKTFDGHDLSVATDAGHDALVILISVFMDNGDSIFSMSANEIRFNNNDNRYIRLQKKNVFWRGNLKAGDVYHVSIPGFSS